MDEAALKLRLLELASSLPGVRAGVDHEAQASRAQEVASAWYNYVKGSGGQNGARPHRGRKG